MITKYNFYSDPWHGWLKVKTKELFKLNIFEKISWCSFFSPNWVYTYLEEDCDFDLFVKEKEKQENIKLKWDENIKYNSCANRYSKIRSYYNTNNNNKKQVLSFFERWLL